METAQVAKGLQGNKVYQQRARIALPILVRQAHAQSKMSYAALAAELRISNPRTLNYPLGSIGTALESLSKEWKEEIPAIQCLVVNQNSGLPGNGIGWFVRDVTEFKSLTLRQQKSVVDGVLAAVFSYPRWNEVLDYLGLKPVDTGYRKVLDAASAYASGGESDSHLALKEFVALHPSVVGLHTRTKSGLTEVALPSGDRIDVFFEVNGVRLAVEVKSRISCEADIVRGLFQCVKYRSVLAAMISVENSNDAADSVLVLEGSLPENLRVMQTILGVAVFENVTPFGMKR